MSWIPSRALAWTCAGGGLAAVAARFAPLPLEQVAAGAENFCLSGGEGYGDLRERAGHQREVALPVVQKAGVEHIFPGCFFSGIRRRG